MRTLFAAVLSAVLIAGSAALADDLYRVRISSHEDARSLRAVGPSPVMRLPEAFLVLVDSEAVLRLSKSALSAELIARDVSVSELAIDNRLDRKNVDRYDLILEDGGLRLYRVSRADLKSPENRFDLIPLRTEHLKIDYRPTQSDPEKLAHITADLPDGLDSLVARVEYDSLYSYLHRLQAFYRRTVGTDSNYASRDWIAAKFEDFGYQNVVIDSFYHDFDGDLRSCQNVVASKIGTVYPDHHIIVGAHRDAVASSPGADDNGSGTVAVMEIARALTDMDVPMTIDFVLFDAEEIGLYGAWEYATRAYLENEQIICMLNMDMIAHLTNDTDINIIYGNGSTYPLLWAELADSLTGLTGHLYVAGSGGSDHWPFLQLGYPALFLHEWDFSTVYHSYRDSTTYINFDYMTEVVRATAATAYTIAMTTEPPPFVTIDFVTPLPDLLPFGQDVTLELSITGSYGTQIVPGSPEFHWSVDGGDYTTEPLVDLGGGLYSMTLPAAECNRTFDFYVTIDENQTGVWNYGDAVYPITTRVITDQTTHFFDDFQTDQGWTLWGGATDGRWERSYPAAHGTNGSPVSDFSGSGQCFVTGNTARDDDVDGGRTTLYSPLTDFTAFPDALVQFYFSFYSDESGGPYEDKFEVYVSNTFGSYWIPVSSYDMGRIGGLGWQYGEFRLSDYIEPNDHVYIRFDAADYGDDSGVEGALDNVSIVSLACTPTMVCGDINDDLEGPDLTDLIYFVNYLFLGGPPPPNGDVVDLTGEGDTDLSDLIFLVNYLFLGGQAPDCWL